MDKDELRRRAAGLLRPTPEPEPAPEPEPEPTPEPEPVGSDPRVLWSVTCIAKAYGITHVLAHRWTKRAGFPVPIVKVGSRYGWEPEEVRSWAQEYRTHWQVRRKRRQNPDMDGWRAI